MSSHSSPAVAKVVAIIVTIERCCRWISLRRRRCIHHRRCRCCCFHMCLCRGQSSRCLSYVADAKVVAVVVSIECWRCWIICRRRYIHRFHRLRCCCFRMCHRCGRSSCCLSYVADAIVCACLSTDDAVAAAVYVVAAFSIAPEFVLGAGANIHLCCCSICHLRQICFWRRRQYLCNIFPLSCWPFELLLRSFTFF